MESSGNARLTQRLTDYVRGGEDGLLTRWADIIKDLMLDWDVSQDEDEPEQVQEFTTHPELGTLAPQAEIHEKKSSIAQLLEDLTNPKPAALPQIQAVALTHPSSKPTAQSSPLRSNPALTWFTG